VYRLRLRFSKGDSVRWLSHLEISRAWARALARAGAPLKYTEGYSPRPKLAFSPALPVGAAGEAEYLDIILKEPLVPEALTAALSRVLPAGLRILNTKNISLDSPSLGAAIAAADYRISLAPACPENLREASGPDFGGLVEATEGGMMIRRLPISVKPSAVVARIETESGQPFKQVLIDRTMLWVLVNGILEAPA
jgi:hypothetical protein